MPSPSVTYTFANSTTADATQVNQNFTDLINGLTDGTKDLSISALTAAGTATLNGSINLGNASGDDLTITASLASSLAIKTNTTYNIGSATLGLLSVYIGGTGSFTTRILGAASATWTLTLPATAGSSGQFLKNTGSGTSTWGDLTTAKVSSTSKTSNYTATATDDLILVDGSGGAFTITLPTASGITGKIYTIRRTDNTPANAVTIDGDSSETIDGATTRKLYTQYEAWQIVSDGTNWVVITHKTITPWTSFTPTAGAGFGTVSSNSAYWRRVGDSIEVHGAFTSGTVGSGASTISLPASATIDTGKVVGNSQGNLGWWNYGNSGAADMTSAARIGACYYDSGNGSSVITFTRQTNATGYVTGGVSTVIGGSTLPMMYHFTMPVTNWDA